MASYADHLKCLREAFRFDCRILLGANETIGPFVQSSVKLSINLIPSFIEYWQVVNKDFVWASLLIS